MSTSQAGTGYRIYGVCGVLLVKIGIEVVIYGWIALRDGKWIYNSKTPNTSLLIN